MKLSVIIPFYNVQKYTDELLDCLAPQVTKDVEVMVVDDGSKIPFKTKYDWVRVERKENGGVSTARNYGIEHTTGEYISFIDADDLVANDYIKQIIEKIDNEHFDYLEMSWNSMAGGAQWSQKLNSINDSLPNPSVCTRAFKRDFIGDLRFNEKKYSTEDDEFKRKLYYGIEGKKKAVITDYLYHYRTYVENSKSKRFMKGELPTKRIIYYFNHITKDMSYLIDEIAKEDEYNEVWVLTNQNDLPELAYYAHIKKPFRVQGMELRGEPFDGFTLIKQALHAQVVIWTHKTLEIGGIESFIYNFCMVMKEYYDIVVLYDEMAYSQIARLQPHVQVIKNDKNERIVCDTLIVNRLVDSIPPNVVANQTIQMCHTCNQTARNYHIPQDKDKIICVSETSKESFGKEAEKGIVIKNMVSEVTYREPLLLISATRLDTNEKGQKRMVKLANQLNAHGIPFTWLCFSNVNLMNVPNGIVFVPPTLDIGGYIKKADYLVQLSTSESFCYSIVESLSLGTPVICTELPVLGELNVIDGVNAHVLPMGLDAEYDVKKIYNNRLKGFEYKYDNTEMVKKWREVLGDTIPKHNYSYTKEPIVRVRVLLKYFDVQLQTNLVPTQVLEMKRNRAIYLKGKGFIEILE